jgi:eukaryotic-like serine/threonine-protein kinase
MGQVYRARDPRLKRDVAIKVLLRAGTDPVRRQRFTDEAQAASALNHPNIVTVYDVGIHDDTPFIVSEVIEGSSIRDLLARAPMPVSDVLELGMQMADGLAAAHQAGIVHRDFKPENVMVTRDGRVKILDFGLASVGIREGASSDLAVTVEDVTLTANGAIVGTVPYMSPEQARGLKVDYRTDQFSLGLTLYEMLAGRRAFIAETAPQILAAILDTEPESIAKVNPRVPPPVRWTIERCLAKDARRRYDATSDLARELRTLRERLPEFTTTTQIDVAPPAPRRRRMALLTGAAVAVVVATGVAVALARGGTDAGLDRYRYTPFATDAGYQGTPAWSPDGKTVAYVADVDGILQVFQKRIGSPDRTQVTHGSFASHDPFWSPDGTRLYYLSLARDRDGLWSISAAGGLAEIVMEDVNSASLSPDGKTLAFFRTPEEGKPTLFLSSPPGSPAVAYSRASLAGDGNSLATIHFSPDGSRMGAWIIANQHPEFWVLPTDTAPPYTVRPPVSDLPDTPVAFTWLPDSRRVISAMTSPRPGVHLWLTDTWRGVSRLLTVSGTVENDPAASPDGATLALSAQQADYDLYEFSVDRPSPSIALATSRSEMDPAWSASGSVMAFTTDRSGREEIWLRSQKGDFERPLVTPNDFGSNETLLLSAPAMSPDGQRVAYNRVGPEGDRVWITSVAGGPPVQLAPGDHPQDYPSWSPDGLWIAYEEGAGGAPSQVKGSSSLVKMRVGARTPAERITSDNIPFSGPQWSPDGGWIAYNGRGGLSLVSPDGKSTRVLREQTWLAFTWSADSQRLFGIRQSDDYQHLTFTSVEIRSGAEHVLGPDVMPLPTSSNPVRGLTRVSPTTFLASIVKVHSDVWLLEGFQPVPTLWERVTSLLIRRR